MCKYCFNGNPDPWYEHHDPADAQYFQQKMSKGFVFVKQHK